MRRGHQGRTDGNQQAIIGALRDEGLSVCSLASVGGGAPDLLIGSAGQTFLVEVKNGGKSPSARTLTADQRRWVKRWTGSEVRILTDTDQATSWARTIAAVDDVVRPKRYEIQDYIDAWGGGVA